MKTDLQIPIVAPPPFSKKTMRSRSENNRSRRRRCCRHACFWRTSDGARALFKTETEENQAASENE